MHFSCLCEVAYSYCLHFLHGVFHRFYVTLCTHPWFIFFRNGILIYRWIYCIVGVYCISCPQTYWVHVTIILIKTIPAWTADKICDVYDNILMVTDDQVASLIPCSSFAPENFIRCLEIDTSDQQVTHFALCALQCYLNLLILCAWIFLLCVVNWLPDLF